MKETTKKWIEAGVELSKDTKSKVKCPECQNEYLEVQDIASDTDPNLIERIIKCSSCGACNAMRINKNL